jgi:tripartite-type tricarboxylate transporter receptor subunit TctC
VFVQHTQKGLNVNKLQFLNCLTTGLIFLSSSFALQHAVAGSEENFPDKPVRMIVPIAAGGSADKLTRILSEKLSIRWGQPVVVENIVGAGGTIGTARAAKATPDGYTILQQGEGMTLNTILYSNLSFDARTAFAPVIKAVVSPQILVVNPQTGLATFEQYLDRAKKRPDSINLALPTNGGIAHIAHELIHQQTGAQVNYIPYGGGGPATVAVIAGHTDATLITLAAVTEYVRAGRLTALAVTTPVRSKALPDVPTMAEAGIPGFSVESWQGYFVPAGTPVAIVQKINHDIQAVLDTPEVRAQLENMGFNVEGGTSASLANSLSVEYPVYAQAVQQAGIVLR